MLSSLADKIAFRIRSGYLGAFILLLVSYIVSFVSTQNLVRQSARINHSNEVLRTLDNVLRYVTESESAARGYLITNNQNLLDKFHKSGFKADSAWMVVKQLTSDNAVQQKNVDSVKRLIDSKLDLMRQGLLFYDSTHTLKPLLSNQRNSIQKMDNVENYIHFVQATEVQLMYKRTDKASRYSKIIKIFIIVSLLFAILLTLYSLIIFNKENKAKQEAGRNADAYRRELERRVNELHDLNLELIELRNMEKFAATGRIARTIAHEVRNPLTNINLAVEQLKNESRSDDDVDLLFDMVQRNSGRINQLIGDLLNATRVSELSYEKISIHEVLDQSLELARDRIELKKIQVIRNYDPGICPVFIDREKILIAFLNIVVNAVEAMNEYGVLHISTENKNQKCIVKISDNGTGMTKEVLNNLFEPFFTTKEKGTGLGLTNTQNIILAHGGTITVESESNKGSAFIMSFNLV